LVVGFDRQAAFADGQQPGAERVAVELAGDVGSVDDVGQAGKGGVATELEGVDEDLEGALVAAVGELGVGGVEGATRPRSRPRPGPGRRARSGSRPEGR